MNSAIINSILELGPALTDKGNLAKLHDCHALNIFTISNSLKIFFTLNSDTFFSS